MRAVSPPSSSQDSLGEGGQDSPKSRRADSPLWSMKVVKKPWMTSELSDLILACRFACDRVESKRSLSSADATNRRVCLSCFHRPAVLFVRVVVRAFLGGGGPGEEGVSEEDEGDEEGVELRRRTLFPSRLW